MTSPKKPISLLAKRIVLFHNRAFGAHLDDKWFLLFLSGGEGKSCDWRRANEKWYRSCGSLTVKVDHGVRLTWAEAQDKLDSGAYGPVDAFCGPAYSPPSK